MKKDKLVIFGNSDFSKLVSYYFKTFSNYNLIAFCVDDEYVKSDTFEDLRLIPYSKLKSTFSPKDTYMFVAVGYNQLNSLRAEIYAKLKLDGYKFASFVHPTSILPPSEKIIGENCLILENNVVQPFSKIEDDVFIWSNSFIAHNSIVKQHCFIASNVSIGGFTIVKENCFIGMSTTIRDKINIGCNCLIGAGLTILEDVKDFSVFINAHTKPTNISSKEYFQLGHGI